MANMEKRVEKHRFDFRTYLRWYLIQLTSFLFDYNSFKSPGSVQMS